MCIYIYTYIHTHMEKRAGGNERREAGDESGGEVLRKLVVDIMGSALLVIVIVIVIVIVMVIGTVTVTVTVTVINTNGAAAKVMIFDRLGKKVRPGTFGKLKVIRLPGVPKTSLCQKH